MVETAYIPNEGSNIPTFSQPTDKEQTASGESSDRILGFYG